MASNKTSSSRSASPARALSPLSPPPERTLSPSSGIPSMLILDSALHNKRNTLTPRKRSVYETTILHKLVLAKDLVKLRKILPSSENLINAQSPRNNATALVLACASSTPLLEIVSLLLSVKTIRVDIADKKGQTALHWASALGRADIARALVNASSSNNNIVYAVDDNGEAPIHRASRYGHVDLVTFFIKECGVSGFLPIKSQPFLSVFDIAGNFKASQTLQRQRLEVQRAITLQSPSDCFKTLVLHHDDCLEHDTTAGHQESAGRVSDIVSALTPSGVLSIDNNFSKASLADIHKVHARSYVKLLLELKETVNKTATPVPLTPRIQVGIHGTRAKADKHCDTSFSAGTMDAALRASGAVIHGIDQVLNQKCQNVFCVVRPPGHHAGSVGLLTDGASCGFCIFNNVMVGASYALHKYPKTIKRIGIIDIDAHHGNGTEDILKKLNMPDQIFFSSVHMFDQSFYPGTGSRNNLNFNVLNSPLSPCWKKNRSNLSGRDGFRTVFRTCILPALRAFNPDLILISAGFDGALGDIGNKASGSRCGDSGMDLLPQDYHWVTTELKGIARICCEGRLVSVLEGGYGKQKTGSDKDDLDRSGFVKCALGHLDGLTGEVLVPEIMKPEGGITRAKSLPVIVRSSKRRRKPSEKASAAACDTASSSSHCGPKSSSSKPIEDSLRTQVLKRNVAASVRPDIILLERRKSDGEVVKNGKKRRRKPTPVTMPSRR